MALDYHSASKKKIALFRELFRGREEVYASRFVSRKTGQAGYSPVCGNEWVRGICEKPRIKCSDCPHQNWLAVSDEVVGWHLRGKDAGGQAFVMGMYPLLLDERCWFLAVDFDGEGWMDEVSAFLSVCRECEVSAALERSRSGNGGHVWLFFAEPVAATMARALGAALLTRATARCPRAKLAAYDRFFPNQDTLPRGGFGNLIALPLQREPRDAGNSLFVDDAFEPWPDQWRFLSMIEKISLHRVETVVGEAKRRGGIVGVKLTPDEDEDEPWKSSTPVKSKLAMDLKIAGKLKKIAVVLSDQIYLPKEGLPPALHDALVRIAAFQNPEFTRRRRCDCLLTISRASSPVRRIFPSI